MGTALAHYAYPEETDMEPDKTHELAVQFAELRREVQYAQSDIKEIKADIREFKTYVEMKFNKLDEKIGGLKDSLSSAKIWALGMYITLAGQLLYVISKSAKWV